MMPLEIRPASAADAPAIVALCARSFEPARLRATIYGAPRIAAFVRVQAALPHELAERLYAVAAVGGDLVGFIELRRVDRAIFLNHIAVAESARGRGVAGQLLAAALEMAGGGAGAGAPETMLLDVFTDNTVAAAWYERLGFAGSTIVEWWALPIGALPAERHPATFIADVAQARACHDAYGFSQVAVHTPSGRHVAGRIGDYCIRLTSPDALRDPALAAVLGDVAPARRVVALVPEGQLPAPYRDVATPVARSRRMQCPMPRLLAALNRTTDEVPA